MYRSEWKETALLASIQFKYNNTIIDNEKKAALSTHIYASVATGSRA